MLNIMLLPWAIILGLLGAGGVVLLKMWNEDEWAKPRPRMIAGLILGPLAALLMWLVGDGYQFVGLIAYFLAGVSGPSLITELMAKYTKNKEKKAVEEEKRFNERVDAAVAERLKKVDND